ncbi:RHS repeat domain-containing protein [Chryseobacterium luquanense]|uniref:RHS repeat-associated core domain-containing protein n=1 Tax=Chryseobacterium luquanense TaxID=2983766 RepID=A0ABT3Y8B0_9FLAO|nr:RHS repeat-associated core domain-containing protein [Chryseobacterium luquanense]MCX8534405.1 RHS repeat-associated core domain-containing protein [Chryseobacterium luquanense]
MVQQNDYYAFGLRYSEGINAGGSYKYEYNGKELQEEIGMYDYGARFYMPDLGRWGVVDPLAETSRRFTPYHYGNNNPMKFIDPDGRSAMDSFYDYHNFSNENRPMFSTDGAGNMHLNPIYQQNSYIDATGAVGGGILFVGTPTAFGFLQDYFGNGGAVGTLFSMVDQLKAAGWNDPAMFQICWYPLLTRHPKGIK